MNNCNYKNCKSNYKKVKYTSVIQNHALNYRILYVNHSVYMVHWLVVVVI